MAAMSPHVSIIHSGQISCIQNSLELSICVQIGKGASIPTGNGLQLDENLQSKLANALCAKLEDADIVELFSWRMLHPTLNYGSVCWENEMSTAMFIVYASNGIFLFAEKTWIVDWFDEYESILWS